MSAYITAVVVFVFCLSFVDCRRKTAFEGTPVTLTCPSYYRVVVSQAIYADLLVGRATCSDPNANEKIVSLCEQKQTCSFTPDVNTFSSTCNEASTRHRFLVDYTCLRDMCLVYSTFCDNGGSCLLNKIGAPYCKCAAGFGGYNCEFSAPDPCLSSPRPNCGNGKCTVNSVNQAVCQCTGNWTGDNCDVSPCTINTCLNNGTCMVKSDGTPICLCQGDWSGNDCSVSPCSINPCLNNGTCFVDNMGGAKCSCLGDYLGYFCSVSPCENYNLCQNNGTCTASLQGKASCSCKSPYIGQFCAERFYCLWRGKDFTTYTASGSVLLALSISPNGDQVATGSLLNDLIQITGNAWILRRDSKYACFKIDQFQSNENQFVFYSSTFKSFAGAGDTLSTSQICELCEQPPVGLEGSCAADGYSPIVPIKAFCKQPPVCTTRSASCPDEVDLDIKNC